MSSNNNNNNSKILSKDDLVRKIVDLEEAHKKREDDHLAVAKNLSEMLKDFHDKFRQAQRDNEDLKRHSSELTKENKILKELLENIQELTRPTKKLRVVE